MLDENPALDAVFGRVRLKMTPGTVPSRRYLEIDGTFLPSAFICSGLFRRGILDRVGSFAETMSHGEDVDYNTRLVEAGMKVGLCEVDALVYRRHGSNMTNDRQAATAGFFQCASAQNRQGPATFRARCVKCTSVVCSVNETDSAPMKVLALTPQYLPVMGGIEILLGMLIPRLRQYSVETVVVTDKDQFGQLLDHELVEDTIVHRLNFRKAMREFGPTGTLAIQQQLRSILDAEKPDLIHMHSAVQHGAWYLQRAIKKMPSRPPLIITQHGGLEQSDRLAFVRRAPARSGCAHRRIKCRFASRRRVLGAEGVFNRYL